MAAQADEVCMSCGGFGFKDYAAELPCPACSVITTQFADGRWYYATKDGLTWEGPFMTKTCALQHAKDGTFRVID